jgi:hypothetical protein
MKQTNTVMLAIFVALGVMLVAGLVAIPAIHEAQAVTLSGLDNRIRQSILDALRDFGISGDFGL